MKYLQIYCGILLLLISTGISKKLKKAKSQPTEFKNMRYKSLDTQNYDDVDPSPRSMQSFPSGMQRPPNAPDIPEEMPDYLEKELDMLKENDTYGVNSYSNIYNRQNL